MLLPEEIFCCVNWYELVNSLFWDAYLVFIKRGLFKCLREIWIEVSEVFLYMNVALLLYKACESGAFVHKKCIKSFA